MFSPLQVEVGASVYCRVCIALLAFFSLLSVWAADLVVIYKLLLFLACIGYSFFCWSRLIWFNSQYSVTGLRWLVERKGIAVCLSKGGWVHVDRIEQKFIFPFLIGLKLRLCTEDRSVTVLIWRDSVTEDDYRKLRVLCRFAPPPVSAIHS